MIYTIKMDMKMLLPYCPKLILFYGVCSLRLKLQKSSFVLFFWETNQANANVGEFKIPSSMKVLNVSYATCESLFG